MLKTGKKCNWDEIKIGEVFAYNGCWMIGIKKNKNHWNILAEDWTNTFDEYEDSFLGFIKCWKGHDFYKLPKSIQKLWKEE